MKEIVYQEIDWNKIMLKKYLKIIIMLNLNVNQNLLTDEKINYLFYFLIFTKWVLNSIIIVAVVDCGEKWGM